MENNVPVRKLHVLMISLDPGLINPDAKTGNSLERHLQYAQKVSHLDIIVLGGEKPAVRDVSDRLRIHVTGVSGWKNIIVGRKLGQRIMSEKKYDLIVTQDPHGAGWVGMKLKEAYKVPLLVDFHGDFWNNIHWKNENIRNRLYDSIQKKVVARADGVRVVSEGIREALLASGVSPEKVEVISTPINDALFTSDQEKIRVLVEELRYHYGEKPVLLHVGRFYKARNLLFLLAVVKELKQRNLDFILIMIGEGEQLTEMNAFISENKLDEYVRILKSRTQEELIPYYALARTLVLVSTNESFGKVIIEAGLSGTPTVASAAAGPTYVIEDGKTGFIVPINDLKGTADVLEAMILNPDDANRLGDQARKQYTERFSSEKTICHVVEFWGKTAQA